MLVRLMYASRAVPAVDQEELIAILKKSKTNNAKSGVTGALCFSEGVFIQADHFCMHWRGIKDSEAKMTNSVMRGSFLTDPALRREFLSLRSTGS